MARVENSDSTDSTFEMSKEDTQRMVPLRSPDSHVRHDRPASSVRKSRNQAAPVPTVEQLHTEEHRKREAQLPSSSKEGISSLKDLDDNGDGKNAPRKMFSNGFEAAGKKISKTKGAVEKQLREKHAVERAITCVFAVLLVWISSLAVARFLARQWIDTPAVEEVARLGLNALQFTQTERDRYQLCANRRVNECNETFYEDLEAEKERTRQALENNRDILDVYVDVRDDCDAKVSFVIEYLKNLQDETGVNLVSSYSNSNVDNSQRCSLINNLLLGQAAAIGSLGIATEFQVDTDTKISTGYDRLEARMAYDQEYLANLTGIRFVEIGLELNANLPPFDAPFIEMSEYSDKLVACSRVDGKFNSATCDPSPAKRFNDLREATQSRYNAFASRLQQWVDRAASIRNILSSFMGAFQGVPNVASWFSDIFGLSLPSGSLPNMPSVNQFINPDHLLNGVPSFSNILNQYDLNVQDYFAQISIETNIAENIRNALKNATLDWQTGFFDDYDPPGVDIPSRRSSWTNFSGPFLPSLSSQLNNLTTAGSSRTERYNSPLNGTSVPRVSSSFLQSLDPRDWTLFFYDMDINTFLAQYNYITWLALFFDYIYRTLRSISIIRKYWRISAVFTPPADVRVDSQKIADKAPDGRNPIQRAAYWMTHPGVMVGIGVIFTSIILAAFLRLYLPIYFEYAKGCVAATNARESQGTMITRNMNTMAYQFSALDGDKTITNAIDRINALREVECTSEEDDSNAIQKELDEEWRFIVGNQRQLQFRLNAINDCLDVAAIDTDVVFDPYRTYTSGGLSAASLQAAINMAADTDVCNKDLIALNSAESVFDCSNIEVCSPECRGPNERVIESTVFTAGCTGENYIHSSVMTGSMSIIVFFLMNLSRLLMMEGLIRIYWRHLTSNKFSYLGTCFRNGDLEYPDIVKYDGWTIQKLIARELQKSLRKFERAGAFLLFLAIAVNIPWIVLLDVISRNLDFDESNVE